MISAAPILAAVAALAGAPLVASHAAFWTPAMWGFNVTDSTYPYDNRPLVPLYDMTFDQWWFHGHLDHPPNPGDFFELPAGGVATGQISCDKGSTSYYASSAGGNAGYPTDNVCVGQPMSNVQPEDFAIFTTNATCPWTLHTDFHIPAAMPECPDGGCICAFFWIHQPDSGSEQMYMNGFRCKVTGATGTTAIGKAALARRCGADPANGVPNATPSNCTVGPKQPLYWDQKERNNMFEGIYSPPMYLPLYGFESGAQNDIFQAATVNGVPVYGADGAPGKTSISVAPPAKTTTNNLDHPPLPSTTAQAPPPPPSSQPAPPPPAETTPAPPPPPASQDNQAAPTTTAPAPSTTDAPAPASTKKCSSKKKRSAGSKRHHAKRLSHSLHHSS
ncbi:hypothetical protein EIP91_007709 [Steccherinum ochraceum]|uniref:Chitin-binding type-4 domain-containing protein n=1 Tax=Steccherinum ochraceum TaxID=92696 RepID=A0A4V2MVD4_9APHY|nr:hypothetical protein EIP91_007709 [Steccherinum ochraceum]